ncbi:hypothetical protein HBI56_107380 [Parastagonospora nodorum]|uniref:Uncharacterized protein n=1 Tax=Phaeosphaeria nodorum (strain SN15 / ATCC MYA-4574 / FGSC 10173) TaxID=321614 RepID=A0A7U2FH55_PHANO|nr:hypothetical protein HBH56_131500 [Parastagonospora nodorum]QRD02890.1 hypothetical protein JI435_418790 [Parastagonospora nodorum SN15]KAH3937949.1 hypothetical protein HBH54_007190 [Parastagonospora nodorum]KAH3949443.1 hypothetical protein HBH53_086460 [Parastagonospora nodorum]KAH3974724.1 hypothetical protein HBH52_135110 [Parastagonospora nodorum]
MAPGLLLRYPCCSTGHWDGVFAFAIHQPRPAQPADTSGPSPKRCIPLLPARPGQVRSGLAVPAASAPSLVLCRWCRASHCTSMSFVPNV